MLDFKRLLGFDWGAGNERKSADKHGVTQAEAEQAFFNDPILMTEDVAHSCDEPRLHVLGRTNAGRSLNITFTLRQNDTRIRVTSARDMHRKERSHYDKED